MTAKEKIEQVANELGITMTCEFVPWSKSRNAKEKQPSLNWKVTLWNKIGKVGVGYTPFIAIDYMAGCAHCPSYQQHVTEAVRQECESGRTCANVGLGIKAAPILPVLADVLYSLVNDCEALDAAGFEDWADNFGHNKDSRKAEAIYRACLDTGLRVRNALGDSLRQLREACQDY